MWRMGVLKKITVLLIPILLSGCIGFQYVTYVDLTADVQRYPEIYEETIKEKLINKPYEVYEKDGNKVYVFDFVKRERRGNNYGYLLIPFPLPMTDIETQTELHFKGEEVYKIIYRNHTQKPKGFGFVCAPPIWGGGDWCKTLP
jgi:hypothetical protein